MNAEQEAIDTADGVVPAEQPSLPETPKPEPQPAEAKPAPARAARGGLFEWLWRGRALAEARGWFRALPEAEQRRLQRAQVAAELADRALDPIDPLRAGSSTHLAISLYREAAYWALLAQDARLDAADLRGALAVTPAGYLEFAAGGSEGLEKVRAVLVDKSFVQSSADLPEIQESEARIARDFVHALLRDKTAPQQRIGEVLLERWARTLSVVLVLAAAAIGVTLAVQKVNRAPDLAAGKPWRASSSLDTCRPAEHMCAGARTDIFFHTVEEKDPWLEIDLGFPQKISVVEITNRSDCCPERAVPLAIEISNDRNSWREVIRHKETFSVWRAEFPTRTARYVRMRALKRTLLHFEAVKIYAH